MHVAGREVFADADALLDALRLRPPCVGGSFNGYGVDEARTLAWKARMKAEDEVSEH